MSEEEESPFGYRAPVSNIQSVKAKYDALQAFTFECMKWHMSLTPVDHDKLSKYAEQYNFSFRVSRQMEEWTMRETVPGGGEPEIGVTEEEVKYLQSVALIDIMNEVNVALESNISFMKH